jgi:hypothetical protein
VPWAKIGRPKTPAGFSSKMNREGARIGRPLAAMAAGLDERQCGVAGKWAEGEVSEVVHPFWATIRSEALRDGSLTVVLDD